MLNRVALSRDLAFGLVLCCCTVTAFARAPDLWLASMSEAVASRNYEGTLVYMQPGMAETFHVYHRVADGKSTERVVSMDGDGAEIIRTEDEVICIFPGQEKVVVDKRQGVGGEKNPLRARLPELTPEVAQSYRLSMLPTARIIGRQAVVVEISPQDNFRFGYRLWLDEGSAMPLKIQVLDIDESMPVEELFFTSINMPEELPQDSVTPSLDTAQYTWVRHGLDAGDQSAQTEPANWRVADLPSGFMQTAMRLEYMADSSEPRTHLVYSDGLASVSVFIDSGAEVAESADGFVSMGAANSYTRAVGGTLVTAMGEVPPRTVKKIAVSLELVDAAGEPAE